MNKVVISGTWLWMFYFDMVLGSWFGGYHHKPLKSYLINTDFTLIESHQPTILNQCLPNTGLTAVVLFVSLFYLRAARSTRLNYEFIQCCPNH